MPKENKPVPPSASESAKEPDDSTICENCGYPRGRHGREIFGRNCLTKDGKFFKNDSFSPVAESKTEPTPDPDKVIGLFEMDGTAAVENINGNLSGPIRQNILTVAIRESYLSPEARKQFEAGSQLPKVVAALEKLIYACNKAQSWDEGTRIGMAIIEADAALSSLADGKEGKS